MASSVVFYAIVAALLLIAGLRFGWHAWVATGAIGRRFVALLGLAGVGLIAAGSLQGPIVWALLLPGIASSTAVVCWMIYQAMAFEGVSPNLVEGPKGLDAVEGVVLDVASLADRDDD